MSDCTGVVPSAPGAAAPGWAGKPRPRGPVAGVEITDMFSAVVVGDGVDLGEAAAAAGWGLAAGVRGGDSASLSVSRFPPPLHRFLHTQRPRFNPRPFESQVPRCNHYATRSHNSRNV